MTVPTEMFSLMEQPEFWQGFPGGIICPYCNQPLTQKNGTLRTIVAEGAQREAIYEFLCVDCHVENRTDA